MNIAFWSEEPGHGATSFNMYVIALALSTFFKKEVILFKCQYSYRFPKVEKCNNTNSYFKEDYSYYNHRGMDAIIDRALLGVLDPLTIRDNLSLLEGTSIGYFEPTHKSNEEVFMASMNKIISEAAHTFADMEEVFFVDTISGYNPISKAELESADFLVCNISPCTRYNDSFIKLSKTFKDRIVYIYGRYDSRSCYDSRHICKELNIKNNNLGIIPYNIELLDAIRLNKEVSYMRGTEAKNSIHRKGVSKDIIVKDSTLVNEKIAFYHTLKLTAKLIMNAINQSRKQKGSGYTV